MAITGVEIDLVVEDSIKALELYETVFGTTERIEATDLDKGLNEAIFSLYGTRIHLLDENPEYMMVAPKEGDPKPFWINVAVEDIHAVFERALASGCTEVTPLTDMPQMGITNGMFSDPFGYIWLLHQIHREVGLDERLDALGYGEGGQEK